MRVLFLTKQQYMAKDLLRDRFGRFYEIPEALARMGHEVRGVCLKYWSAKDRGPGQSQPSERVEWSSFPLGQNWPWGFLSHYRRSLRISASFAPDIVIGASDPAHIIMASWIGEHLAIPWIADLYDNFESYRATRFPGMKQLLRRAVSKAAAVSVVSDALLVKVRNEYHPKGITTTITNAVAPEIFHLTDKRSARRRLGLPEIGTLIGTAGALTLERGIDTLYAAFNQLNSTRDDLSLVLAGPVDWRLKLRPNRKIIFMGELPHERVGDLFNALDLGIVCIRNDEFGRYCFPQKLFEMIACGLPVVASDVGAVRAIMQGAERFLYAPGSVASLTSAIGAQLDARRLPEVTIPTWSGCGLAFGTMMDSAVTAAVKSTYKVRTAYLQSGRQ